MTDSALTGRTFDVDLGPFVPRIRFISDTQMQLAVDLSAGRIDEVVPINLTSIRPNVFMVSWLESSGNFVVQVQDHDRGIVHNHARLADGQLFTAEGTIRPTVSAQA